MKNTGTGRSIPASVASQVAFARLATALAVVGTGALAVGAVAIGALAIRSLRLSQGTVERLRIEELDVGRLRVRELITEPGRTSEPLSPSTSDRATL